MADHTPRMIRADGAWRAECRACGWLTDPVGSRNEARLLFRYEHPAREPDADEA